MVKIIIDIMPKPDLADPQGRAIATALATSGQEVFSGVRVGKRFELFCDSPPTAHDLNLARDIAGNLLANPVIEDVVDIRVEDS